MTVMTVLVALIGFFGSGAVGVWIADWLRRRDIRSVASVDLDIWDKLPDSEVKTELLKSIEGRVGGLLADGRPRLLKWVLTLKNVWVLSVSGALTISAITHASHFIQGNSRIERHADGLLWVRHLSEGRISYELILHSLREPFQGLALLLLLSAIWYLTGLWLGKRIEKAYGRERFEGFPTGSGHTD